MTISPFSIQRFLDYRPPIPSSLKGANPDTLWSELSGFSPKTAPRAHQLEGLVFALRLKRCALFYEMRLGKTWIALNVANILTLNGWNGVGIVIVPRPVLLPVWEEQAHLHSELPVIACSTLDQILDAVSSGKYKLILVSWSGLQTMFTRKARVKTATGKVERLLKPDYPIVDAFSSLFSFAVIDELHYAKNPETIRWRIARRLIKNCEYRIGLTGTPVGRDPFDLWGELYLLDEGQTLGKNHWFFTHAFGKKTNDPFKGEKMVFDPTKIPILHNKIASVSMFYKVEECADLPEVNQNVTKLVMLPQQKEHYRNAIKKFIDTGKHDIIAIKNIFVRLRQISSGFLPFTNPNGEESVLEFPNIKAIWLEVFLETIEDAQVVIFHDFHRTGKAICDVCAEMSVEHSWLLGGIGLEKQKVAIEAFQSKTVQVLVASASAGDVGIDLQIADYEIFYESPVSYLVRRQVEARAKGQGRGKRPLFIEDVICSPVESKIKDYIKEGRDLMAALIRDPASLLEL